MKQLIGSDIGSYTFDPINRMITLLDIPININIINLLVITNLNNNIMIYNFADENLIASINNNNNITLSYDTTGMNSTDKLQIWIDLPSDYISDSNTTLLNLLMRLVKICEPISTQDSYYRQRIAVESMPTTTVTIGTSGGCNVTGIGYPSLMANLVGGNPYSVLATQQPTQLTASIVDQRWEIIDRSQMNYNSSIRQNLKWD